MMRRDLAGTTFAGVSAPGLTSTGSSEAPHPSRLTQLKPRNWLGLLFVGCALGSLTISLLLAASTNLAIWLTGQVLLAVALVQWFVLLHECGHGTLFRSRRFHVPIGHVAGFLSVIPFHCWKRIHEKHHKWTGWQDIDPTMQSLVPRKLTRFEKFLANFCWRFWIPLFAVIYRLNNFWNLPRLRRIFPGKVQRRQITWNILVLLVVYAAAIYVLGFSRVIRLGGLGLVVSLMFQEWIILSQHTHIPQNLSHGQEVTPYPAIDQEPFTRSLTFPRWFSISVLLNMDAHERHHMYPFVPAYYLGRIDYPTENEFGWWHWIRAAKRIPGEVFLFQNRNESGFYI